MDILSKISQAYTIWKNAGLSIRGVRTCGDYMFSGHSVVLTMLNFFITECNYYYLLKRETNTYVQLIIDYRRQEIILSYS